MVVIPYVLFSEHEVNCVRDLIDNKVYPWIESIFGVCAVEASSLFLAHQKKELLGESWCQQWLDEQCSVSVEAISSSIKITANSNEWLSCLGLSPLADHKGFKNSVIRPDEAVIVLNAIAQDFLDIIIGFEKQSVTIEPRGDSELLRRSTIKGAGILFYSVKFNGLLIQVLIDGKQFKAKQRVHDLASRSKTKKIESRFSACANVSTKLRAFLGVVDLSIGDLSKISSGDIIRLDASISDAVSLGLSTAQAICYGNLGVSDDHKALRVVS